MDNPQIEIISGKDDGTAVLPGYRENYSLRLPNAAQYPAITAPEWQKPEINTLYGTSVILEDIETGQKFQLRGVETLIFEGAQAKAADDASLGLPTCDKDGSMLTETIGSLFLQATDEMDMGEIYIAQIAATREAAQGIAKGRKTGMSSEALEELGKWVVDGLASDQISLSNRVAPQPEVTQTEEYAGSQGFCPAPRMK